MISFYDDYDYDDNDDNDDHDYDDYDHHLGNHLFSHHHHVHLQITNFDGDFVIVVRLIVRSLHRAVPPSKFKIGKVSDIDLRKKK